MEENKIIFCLLGKSASGKDTIINGITSINSAVTKVIPTTTRPKRSHEENGYDYRFISEKSFLSKIEKNQFMEHRKYDIIKPNGDHDTWYYGTEFPSASISILTGPLETYEKIKSNVFNSDSSSKIFIIPIYISIPDDERLFRMIRRENHNSRPNYREVARRFIADNNDFNDDYMKSLGINESNTFINMDIHKAKSEINTYINKVIEDIKKGVYMNG